MISQPATETLANALVQGTSVNRIENTRALEGGVRIQGLINAVGSLAVLASCWLPSAQALGQVTAKTGTPESVISDTATAADNKETSMVIDMREALEDTRTPSPPAESSIVNEYLAQIEAFELERGAYAASLPEQLLGLGTALQQLNRHEEAIDVLKRGVHLSRINSGLYSREQIALLRSQIRSHMALGQYDVVDERQRYLYRVERQALGDGSESAEALVRQANWQQQAYMLEVGDYESQSGRLLIMWDLYRMSLNQMIDSYGETDPRLRKPLMGMMSTQYLFAGHRNFQTFNAATATETRIVSLTGEAYRRGESVLNAVLELNIANNVSVSQHIQDLVALGDWAWWFNKEEEAQVYYAQAMDLIPKSAQPETLSAELFSQPTPLPAIAGLEGIPPPTWDDSGDLVLSFDISETGRVKNLERVREPEVETGRAMSRLVRAVRETRFRPPFVDGMPVATEGLVWSFNTQAWATSNATLSQN